jgi:hypothetical protein
MDYDMPILSCISSRLVRFNPFYIVLILNILSFGGMSHLMLLGRIEFNILLFKTINIATQYLMSGRHVMRV